MNIAEKITKIFIKFIIANTEKSEEEIEKVQYGFQIIIMNLFKMIILFLTAYFLKIGIYTLVAFMVFGIFRSFACGVHANTSLNCIIINYIVFLGDVFISINFSLNKSSVVIMYIISLILVSLYAPADTEERPLVSENYRKKLKIRAISVVLTFTLISLLIGNSIYMNIITIAIIEESILITPLAYIIFKKPYKNYENVKL
ncbi:accessory gene regulator B family protein (plasmid) [Clostridium estertheticum]|uniref:Putative AgrB-like protein n=1 Tax=Clostridium estertheticum TaxID=238834 RepID=A0AA47ENX5_9CLOT|nr:accessory gene regulator B family protein [Clostridium estertheticum]MBU3157713.1 accessory gene regulator B family protein [Clostridium estertheticum]MBU3201982.1 accessory gene regulator B family protein [Clostridium estertheticum]WAG63341.1 accessory gene regulator B family protein [Clostridium estertheticum]WAG68246.1 accessory gene regulator B family protein [Clostridium estertheticum]